MTQAGLRRGAPATTCAALLMMLFGGAALAPPAAAIAVLCDTEAGTGGFGECSGTLTYANIDGSNATLTLTLTNDTPSPSPGGFIVAFLLNNPDPAKITGVTLDGASTDPFVLLGSANANTLISPPSFGTFDFGAVLPGSGGSQSFEGGGGDPTDGLAAGGGAGAFLFNLTGNNLGALSATSFLTPNETGDFFGMVRFKGAEGEPGSDKVPLIADGTTIIEIPEPGALVLLGSGLLGLGILAAVRRRARPR